MTAPKRPPVVVVGVDGSAGSEAALRWAEDYSRATGAYLQIVTAWHWPTWYGAPVEAGIEPESDARAVAAKAVTGISVPADMFRSVVEQGAAGNVLTHASHTADLLVVGRRGHGPLVGATLGSVSAYCAHHAHCPVVIVR